LDEQEDEPKGFFKITMPCVQHSGFDWVEGVLRRIGARRPDVTLSDCRRVLNATNALDELLYQAVTFGATSNARELSATSVVRKPRRKALAKWGIALLHCNTGRAERVIQFAIASVTARVTPKLLWML
jgi:hypothetical protein